MTITFNRVATGQFEVLNDGQETGYRIINGSAGLSGRDTQNVYGVVRPTGKVVWIGSLQSAKKCILLTFKKKGA